MTGTEIDKSAAIPVGITIRNLTRNELEQLVQFQRVENSGLCMINGFGPKVEWREVKASLGEVSRFPEVGEASRLTSEV
jgi:hypothetical protein